MRRRLGIGIAVAVILAMSLILVLRRSENSESPPPSIQPTPLPAAQLPVLPSGQPLSKEKQSVSIAPASVPAIYQQVKRKYTDATPLPQGSRFMSEEANGMREARLLALAFPQQVEGDAVRDAQDRSLPPRSRHFAINMLRVLALEGSTSAKSVLFTIASDRDEPFSTHALQVLYQSDPAGEYRALYLKKCEELTPKAFEMLADWTDTSSETFLQSAMQKHKGKPAPEGTCYVAARESLRRIEMLRSPTWTLQLEEILEDKMFQHSEKTMWALRVAQQRGLPTLKETLRRRINAGHAHAVEQLPELAEIPATVLEDSNYALEAQDPHFDDLLIALAKAGGKLSEGEQHRLRVFGYAGDPKERLQELIGPIGK